MVLRRGDQTCPCQCHWNWSWIDGCFGITNISPTDIDAVIERNGRILVIETKHLNEELPTGQQLLFEQFSRKAGVVVVVLWGNRDMPEYLQVCTGGVWGAMRPTDKDSFRRGVQRWFETAEQLKRGLRG